MIWFPFIAGIHDIWNSFDVWQNIYFFHNSRFCFHLGWKMKWLQFPNSKGYEMIEKLEKARTSVLYLFSVADLTNVI